MLIDSYDGICHVVNYYNIRDRLLGGRANHSRPSNLSLVGPVRERFPVLLLPLSSFTMFVQPGYDQQNRKAKRTIDLSTVAES